MKTAPTIVICASASHYQDVLKIEDKLKKLGYKVVSPQTAYIMAEKNDFDVTHYKTWLKDTNDYSRKTKLMTDHFAEIIKGDIVLVVNMEKHNLKGYIGGNVLMELTIAHHYNKPLFIYNKIDENLSIKEEIYGLTPTFLNGKLSHIKKHLQNLSISN